MGKTIPQRLGKALSRTETPWRATKPLLLAPAGNWECVRAAAANGADAVYFGLNQFNARLRADNFTLADLPALMAYLREAGLRGYLTLNTLIFPTELAEAETFLRAVIASGVHAAIVQDLGLCRLIRQLSPDFPIHASTQMTITDLAGVEVAAALGCETVVLARECSLREIAAIREAVAQRGLHVSLEVFVHGALCVAYSGQCLTSESLGGRSANRGECAQACRLPYELVSDGSTVPLNGRAYLLSPQDLSGAELLPELIRTGVSTLKIEGRLKSPEYVAAVSQVYRRAIDRAWEAHLVSKATPLDHAPIPEADRYALEMTFSRGLSTGWLGGIDNQQLVHARYGKKRGLFLGTVAAVGRHALILRTAETLAAGEGVVFTQTQPDAPEVGGRLYGVRPAGRGEVELALADDFPIEAVSVGDLVFKTSDPALDRRLRATFHHAEGPPSGAHPVAVHLTGTIGQPLQATWQLLPSPSTHPGTGTPLEPPAGAPASPAVPTEPTQTLTVTVTSNRTLEASQAHPLTAETLRKQLGRLGDTPFRLASLTIDLPEGTFLPIAALNALRREATEALRAALHAHGHWQLLPAEIPALPGLLAVAAVEPPAPHATLRSPTTAAPILIPYARQLDQLDAILDTGATEIYVELENPRAYQMAVHRVREAEQADGHAKTLWIAPPRIFKVGEDWLLRELETAQPDGILVRNHRHLTAWPTFRKRGDFSLNVANPLTAQWLRDHYHLERVTASYDLNAPQLEALLRGCPPGSVEVTLHQHMPMFHMEHCVFCAFLSSGKDFRDCGRPCEKHQVSLRDRVGQEHPLRADGGCRNTVYNARAQTGAEFADRFTQAGAAAFRIEFLRETPTEVTATLQRYQRLLSGQTTGEELWRALKLINQLGVTRGTLR